MLQEGLCDPAGRPLKLGQLLPSRDKWGTVGGQKTAPPGLAAPTVPSLPLHNRVSGTSRRGLPRWGQSRVCSVHNESSPSRGQLPSTNDQLPRAGKRRKGRARRGEAGRWIPVPASCLGNGLGLVMPSLWAPVSPSAKWGRMPFPCLLATDSYCSGISRVSHMEPNESQQLYEVQVAYGSTQREHLSKQQRLRFLAP